MTIRIATLDDAEAIREIYAPFVESSPATFHTDVPTVAEVRELIDETMRTYPYLVAELDGAVVGYAYGSAHAVRPAYRWSAQVTIYIAPSAHRQGIGRKLYGKLLPLLRGQHFRVAYAGITLPNPASVGLHESFGFKQAATYHRVGHKLGAWRDVGWWELDLQPEWGDDPPPSEPLPWGHSAVI